MPGEAIKLPPASVLSWNRPEMRPRSHRFPIVTFHSIILSEDIEKIQAIMATGGPAEMESGPKVIYFIKGHGVPVVKIGQTFESKLDHRLAELQTGSPVKLAIIMVIACGHWEKHLSIELRLHELFKPLRLHGEWFKMEGLLLEFIQSSGAHFE